MSNTATGTKPKTKGTKSTETIIGAGLSKIEQITANATKAMAEFNKLPEQLAQITLKIGDAESKLQDLSVEYTEKKRQQQVDLELSFKEKGAELVAQYLQVSGKVSISSEELSKLKDDLFKATSDNKSEVDKAVAVATNSVKSKYESDLRVREADFKATEATSKATITTLEDKVKFLTEQVEAWKQALNAERTASVERSKHSSVGSINVAAPGK